MGKWIAIIIAVIISLVLYTIAHISATSIDDDIQEILDEEQTQIVSDILRERENERRIKHSKQQQKDTNK